MGSVYAACSARPGTRCGPSTSGRNTSTRSRATGLLVSGASGASSSTTSTSGTPGRRRACDVWVIGHEGVRVEEVAAGIAPLLRPDDVVMAFQNGLGAGERVARQVPERAHRDRDRRGVRLLDPGTRARAPQRHAADPHRRDARRSDRRVQRIEQSGASRASTSGRSRTSI